MAGIYEPQIKKYEDGVAALRQSIPMAAHDPSVGTSNPLGGPRAPAAPTAPAARTGSSSGVAGMAAGVGGAARRGLFAARPVAANFLSGAAVRAGGVADAATAFPRAVGEAANNARLGFSGRPVSPAAPAPFASAAAGAVQGVRSMFAPRPAYQTTPSTRVRPRPQASVPAAAPADFSDVTGRVARTPVVAAPGTPAVAPASGVPTALQTPDGRPGRLPTGIQHTLDRSGNSVYSDSVAGLAQGRQLADAGFGTGGARVVAPGMASMQPIMPGPAAVPAVATQAGPASPFAARPQPGQVTPGFNNANRYTPRGRQGGIIANPDAMSPLDRIRSLGGDPSLRGSPTLRKAATDQIMGEVTMADAERQSALATGDQADLAAINHQATANEGYATRQLEAQKANLASADSAADREVKREEFRIARKPTVTNSEDGTMGIVSNEGGWTPITSADGKTVRGQQSAHETGELTEAERLKALTELRVGAAGYGPPDNADERISYDERLAKIDGQIETLMNGGSAGAPSYEDFVTDARTKGSKMTDADLRSYYYNNYGQ